MTALTLSDVLATAAYANRNPSYAEYVNGSPCEQRAIEKRWAEIWKASEGDDHGNGAFYNWHRAVIGCRHENDPVRFQQSHHVETGALVNDQRETIALEDLHGE